jgi:hypothetical protein
MKSATKSIAILALSLLALAQVDPKNHCLRVLAE